MSVPLEMLVEELGSLEAAVAAQTAQEILNHQVAVLWELAGTENRSITATNDAQFRVWEDLMWVTDALTGRMGDRNAELWGQIIASDEDTRARLGDNAAVLLDELRYCHIDYVAQLGNTSLELGDKITDIYGLTLADLNRLTTDLNAARDWQTDFLNNRLNEMSEAELLRFATLSTDATGWISDVLLGMAEALGSALESFFSFFWEGLAGVATTLLGAITPVKGESTPTLQSHVSDAVGGVTEAFSLSTLPDEVQKSTDELVKNIQEAIKRLMPKKAESLPPFEEVSGQASQTLITFIGAAVLGNVVGMGIDFFHPFKNIGMRNTIVDVMDTITRNVTTAPIITIPLETGVYRPLRYYYNQMNPYMIPQPMDLIRFVVREVITPDAFNVNMSFQGYDAFWSSAFWEAHWVLPAYGNLREAMWRRIISPEVFGNYVVLHDYKPEPRYEGIPSDRDIMMQLSYELPGRIDSRWMFEQGVIDTATHRGLTEMRGMHPDWIDRVVEAEERASIRTEIEASVRRWAELLKEGFISETDLRGISEGLGLGVKISDFWVSRALTERDTRLIIAEKRAILSSYEGDRMTRAEADTMLAALGILDTVRASELRISDIKRLGRYAA